MPDESTALTGAAWDELITALRGVGDVVTGPLGARDERELAEGYRHVTRVLSVGLEMLLEKGDRQRPVFTRWMSPYRKIFGDNPMTHYDAAVIAPDTTYRIRGNRGTCVYLGFVVYGTAANRSRRIVGHLDDVGVDIADDGSFELWLAPEGSPHVPAGAAVIALEPDSSDLMIRQYFVDRDVEIAATYTIAAVPDPGPTPALDAVTIAARLRDVATFVAETVEVETTLSTLSAMATPSTLRFGDEFVDANGVPTDPSVDLDVIAKVMPSPSIQYAGAWTHELGDREAFVVTGVVPESRYWSVQLLSRWMESGAWHERTSFLACDQVVAGPDGRFRVVVAHVDPGVENWIETDGWRSFNTVVRAIGRTEPMQIDFARVPLADLSGGTA